MPENLENSAVDTGLEKVSFHSNPEECQTTAQLHSVHRLAKSCSNFSKYVNQELPDVQAGFRKGRGTRDQITNIHWIIEKVREFQTNIISGFLTMSKPLTVWITINCGKF